ncbi:MAG: methyl-accepting chemotaxis protein [Desulfuromonadales bacterium]
MRQGFFATIGRGPTYALSGFFLGILAPLGWGAMRLLIFGTDGRNLWQSFFGDMVRSPENIALYLYMGLGTAVVLAVLGGLIGRSHQHMQERAADLDELNLTIAHQKEEFENRFQDLNHNLKNFHSTNTHIQKSNEPEEVIRLAAESLHTILQYDRVNILMFNKERTRLEFAVSRGSGDEDVSGIHMPFDERAGLLYKSLAENKIFLIKDMRQEPTEYHLKPPCNTVHQLRSRSFIICPITVNDEPVGLFAVDNKVRQKTLDDTDVDTVRLFADQVSAALTKIKLLGGIGQLVSELEKTFENILHHREPFSDLVDSLQKGSSTTADTIKQTSESAQTIRTAVDDTSSASTEISAAIGEVSQNLNQLNNFIENSISSMTEISSSSQEVEKTAGRSQEMSEKVKDQAEEGVEMVSKSWQGLQNVSEAVNASIQVIENLSHKSEEIDRIISVINEINAKTHLLSLNASIIAAQAGEQGRSFAVVAEEIRTLSEETTHSADAIEKLVSETQTYTRQAVRQINDTRNKLDEGIQLGRATADSLSEILDSSVEAMEMSGNIRRATVEQVRSSQMVAHSIEELGDMSGQVASASGEQEKGIQRIVHSITEIKGLADTLAEASKRNEKESRQTDEAVATVREMAAQIFSEMEEKSTNSRHIIESLARLQKESSGALPEGERATSTTA